MGSAATVVEACVQTPGSAVAAEAAGAGRIELCANLADGGVTPSAGGLRAARARVQLPIHVLIRPRAGDFVYEEGDVEAMLLDIREARRSGADGVVLGALTRDSTVDRELTGRLAGAARPLAVTFHRAVDRTPDLGAAVATLIELGIDRVLTSGGAETAEQGAPALAALVARFGASITVLAGGRLRPGNALRLVRQTRVPEVHLGPRLSGRGELDTAALRAVVQELAVGG
jgi:copper homeostasis protein